MKHRLACILAVTFCVTPAFATDPASTTAPSDAGTASEAVPGAVPADAKDERICRMERKIGSNRATRVCRTRAEIQALSDASRDPRNAGNSGAGRIE